MQMLSMFLNVDVKEAYTKYSLPAKSVKVFTDKKYTFFISICTNKKDVPAIK